MKFYPLTSSEEDLGKLKEEYKYGREIGKIRLGETWFFFRASGKVYYIPYSEIRRYFRRVMLVPAKLCCGRGDFQMEHLVICGESGELAQIALPGTKAARILMERMVDLAPGAIVGNPKGEERKKA